MRPGFLRDQDQLFQIELACARVSDLLVRATRMEQAGHWATAEALRKQAVDLLDELEAPGPSHSQPRESTPRGA